MTEDDLMDFRAMSDKAILILLGDRMNRQRLNQDMTQAELARHAGVARIVVQRLENGLGCKLENLIRVLRVLGLLEQLEIFLPEPGLSPVQLARLKGHERQRASGTHKRMKGKK